MDIEKIVDYIRNKKTITLIEELIVEMPDLNINEIKNIQEIKNALKDNSVQIQQAIKLKLFQNGTTQSLTELNKMLQQENNSNESNEYINNLVERWFTGE